MATKPRAPTAHPFTHDRISLPTRELTEMIELAGLRPNSALGRELASEITEKLSDAKNYHDSVERGPTQAGRALLLKDVEDAAAAFERAIRALDPTSLMSMPRWILH
jgi:hypothetical protein